MPAFLLIFISCNNPQTSTTPTGIGPVKKLNLTPINNSLVEQGQQLFKQKYSKCHTMEFKNTDPEISNLLADRKPEWLVNFYSIKIKCYYTTL